MHLPVRAPRWVRLSSGCEGAGAAAFGTVSGKCVQQARETKKPPDIAVGGLHVVLWLRCWRQPKNAVWDFLRFHDRGVVELHRAPLRAFAHSEQ